MLKRFLGFAAVSLALTGAAAAQDWRVMTYSDLRKPSAHTPQMAQIWADAIAENNRYFRDVWKDNRFKTTDAPAQFLSHTFKDGPEQIVVSLVTTARHCDNGANSRTSTAIHGICPIRIVVSGPNGSKTLRSTACFLVVRPDDESDIDPKTNATFAAFDPKQGAVTVRSLRDGKPVDGCTTTIKVR